MKTDYRKQMSFIQTKTNNELIENRRFVTLLVNGTQNVATILVKNGFANVIKHKSEEEKSSQYDILTKAQNEAEKKQIGIFGKKIFENDHHINDLTIQEYGKIQKMFNIIKGKKLKANVEKVYYSTKLKLFLPKDYLVINFCISGIISPSNKINNEDEEISKYSRESTNFVINKIALNEVEVEIQSLDKVGNFIGEIFYEEENIGIEILKLLILKI